MLPLTRKALARQVLLVLPKAILMKKTMMMMMIMGMMRMIQATRSNMIIKMQTLTRKRRTREIKKIKKLIS